MKKVTAAFVVILTLALVSCGGNSDSKPVAKEKSTRQAVTMENLMGEWECVDITNGVTHMKSIAKMQPHIVFNDKNEILSKAKLPDGSFVSQKTGSFKIENGSVVSKLYEKNPYLENGKLIIEDPSADNKQIYQKVK